MKSKILKFLHLFRQISRNINYGANEEFFWDQYVKDWEKSEKLKNGQHVGSEWKYEEDFLALLQKYAAAEKEALEIGCGGGRITATGVKLFKHVHAADLSEEMLRKSRETVTLSNVSFHKLDGFALKDFSDSSLDFVYSHDVFVQLSSVQVYPYLMEIQRVLKKGGVGLASFYDFVDQFEMFKQTSLEFWNQRVFPVYRRLHFITEEMLRAMLSDVGLQILEIQKRRFLIVAFRN
jgi:ubiquinone/menaquinone biosynthesis C-methylase UbiE